VAEWQSGSRVLRLMFAHVQSRADTAGEGTERFRLRLHVIAFTWQQQQQQQPP
jgi:hypothetical protein